MRILISPGTYDCLNAGDVGMLQVCVSRLRRFLPPVRISILTSDPIALLRHVPDVDPVPDAGRVAWFGDREILGGIHNCLPAAASRQMVRVHQSLRRRSPVFLKQLLYSRMKLRFQDTSDLQTFWTSIRESDLVLACGQSTITDMFPGHAHKLLDTLQMGIRQGTRTVLLGQGIGPMQDSSLLAKSRAVLPNADLVALREKLNGPELLERLGVPQKRISITGDDAVQLGYERRNNTIGSEIGVNVRIAAHAGVNQAIAQCISATLRDAASRYSAKLLPVPIAVHQSSRDDASIRTLLGENAGDGGSSLDTPTKIIDQIGRCRIIVTGAYHAAVFALSQGIPAVCLCGNEYYLEKFEGLRDMFDGGCAILPLDREDLQQRLASAMTTAWTSAGRDRASLLRSAERQIRLGDAAVADLAGMFSERQTGRLGRPALEASGTH